MSSFVKRLLTSVAALILAALSVFLCIFVRANGGIREVLQLPATVVGDKHVKQDGFCLVAVTRGQPTDPNVTLPSGAKMFLASDQSSGDTILWIAPTLLPPTRVLAPTTASSRQSPFYTVFATSPDGGSFRIPWHYEGGCLPGGGEPCVDTRSASTSPHIIAVVIPAGYPADLHAINVTISDPYHHTATWHLTNLPRMRKVTGSIVRPTYQKDGAVVSLSAVRYMDDLDNNGWPLVHLHMSIDKLPDNAKHHWSLFQSSFQRPSLMWAPYKMPWMRSTSDQSERHSANEFWNFSHGHAFSDEFYTIKSPYVRDNDVATFHGMLVQYETRVDSIHLRNIQVDTIAASIGGYPDDTYSLYLRHKQEIISGSGLTFELPAQHKSQKTFQLMAPFSLNLLWCLKPVSPGHNSATAAMLPDSPLCRQYRKPVSVWFEASADGKPLGVCYGLPDRSDPSGPVMVHFPAEEPLPHFIHNLKIIVHQRVDIQRIPITLSAEVQKLTSSKPIKPSPYSPVTTSRSAAFRLAQE